MRWSLTLSDKVTAKVENYNISSHFSLRCLKMALRCITHVSVKVVEQGDQAPLVVLIRQRCLLQCPLFRLGAQRAQQLSNRILRQLRLDVVSHLQIQSFLVSHLVHLR